MVDVLSDFDLGFYVQLRGSVFCCPSLSVLVLDFDSLSINDDLMHSLPNGKKKDCSDFFRCRHSERFT